MTRSLTVTAALGKLRLGGYVCPDERPYRARRAGLRSVVSLFGKVRILLFLLFILILGFQDISCNELQSLPAELGQLECLRDLNLRRNQLTSLPEGKRLSAIR